MTIYLRLLFTFNMSKIALPQAPKGEFTGYNVIINGSRFINLFQSACGRQGFWLQVPGFRFLV